jgi:hypothetical protein
MPHSTFPTLENHPDVRLLAKRNGQGQSDACQRTPVRASGRSSSGPAEEAAAEEMDVQTLHGSAGCSAHAQDVNREPENRKK